MRVRDMLSFAAFGVLIAVAVSYISALGIRVGLPSDRTDLSIQVADISGLEVGSKVLLRGVQVGRISGITSAVDAATIDFYIGDRFEIPVDTAVTLENLSALGESYLNMVPRTEGGPMLRTGHRIAPESVIQPASVSELATSVVRVLNQLDPPALDRIIGEADAALPPPSSVLPNLSRTSKLLRNTAADMHGRGRDLLDNFQTLLANADWVGPLVGDLSGQLYGYNPHLRDLFATFPPLIETGHPEPMYKFDAFLGRIQGLLDTSGVDFKVIGDRFKPHIVAVAGSMLNFDTAQIFANMLATVPEDGAVKLHVDLAGN